MTTDVGCGAGLGAGLQAPVAHRPMTVADLDRVMAVEVQAYPFPWSRGHFTDSLAAGYLASLRLGRDRRGDDALLGYYVAMPGVEELHLLNLTVSPDVQRRGHACALLVHLAQAARMARAAQIWLEVRESNLRARHLYERWGFEAVGTRKHYYPAAHGQREHAVVMRWEVPAEADVAMSGSASDAAEGERTVRATSRNPSEACATETGRDAECGGSRGDAIAAAGVPAPMGAPGGHDGLV